MCRPAIAEFKLNAWLLFTLFLIFSFTRAADIQYCDKKGDYGVRVSEVEIVPDPVVRGEPATFNISAFTTQAIAGGKVVIEVSYFGFHVHEETHDLCEEKSCPIAAGNFVLSHTQTLPIFTPPGSYKLKMTMEDKNDHKLTCFSFGFKIGFESPFSYSLSAR